jgi:hypothetical protein
MQQARFLYRCLTDQSLLRESDISNGECNGHRVILASGGSFLEWLKVQWWKIKGDI